MIPALPLPHMSPTQGGIQFSCVYPYQHHRQPHLHLILSSAVLHATCAHHLLQAASPPKPHPHNEAIMSLNRSLSLDGCRDDHHRICMRTLPSLGALESVVALTGPSLSALHPASIAAISGIMRTAIGHDDLRGQVRFYSACQLRSSYLTGSAYMTWQGCLWRASAHTSTSPIWTGTAADLECHRLSMSRSESQGAGLTGLETSTESSPAAFSPKSASRAR